MRDTSHDVAVCESCYMAYHYGIGSVEIAHDPTTGLAPLELIPADYDITDISYSPLDDGHTVFSKSPCDGCGSLLAGSRWALVVSEITV
jgi:hypothetical protein